MVMMMMMMMMMMRLLLVACVVSFCLFFDYGLLFGVSLILAGLWEMRQDTGQIRIQESSGVNFFDEEGNSSVVRDSHW